MFVACEIHNRRSTPTECFDGTLIKVDTSHQVCDNAPMGCCVKTGSGSSCSGYWQVRSSYPPSNGHHERFINRLPPFLFAVSLHTMSISGTMQGQAPCRDRHLWHYEGGHEALRHSGLRRRRSRQHQPVVSSRSLTCAHPCLCRFQLWCSLCRETFFSTVAAGSPTQKCGDATHQAVELWDIHVRSQCEPTDMQHFRRLSLWLSVVCAQLAPATLCLAR